MTSGGKMPSAKRGDPEDTIPNRTCPSWTIQVMAVIELIGMLFVVSAASWCCPYECDDGKCASFLGSSINADYREEVDWVLGISDCRDDSSPSKHGLDHAGVARFQGAGAKNPVSLHSTTIHSFEIASMANGFIMGYRR
jgi:hypothetical protein